LEPSATTSTSRFTLKLCILLTQFMYVYRMILTIKSSCFHIQHAPIGTD
jgi:hypothetical protein